MSMRGMILLDRYELGELIGTGGMAVVYRARDIITNATVAIKMLKQEYNNDIEFVRRFQREAIAAQTMLHPNIIKVMDVGEQNNIKFIVMEYVDGVTIKDIVQQSGAFAIDRALDYAIQIARALEHAHRCHIVHRDIKSQNIMVDKRGIVKVADFGIARATNSSTVTASDEGILGSVHYFSPEQAEGKVADEKSDIYSLGVVIYEMVTGQLPFDGEAPVAVALKHIQTPPVEPKKLNPDIPGALNEVILKALRKNREKRYKSAIALELDLSMVLTHPQGGYVVLHEDDIPKREVVDEDDEDVTTRGGDRRGRAIVADGEEEDDFDIPDEYGGYVRRRRRRRIAVLTICTVIAVMIVIFASISLWSRMVGAGAIDDMTGMPMEEAIAYLREEGLENGLIDVYSSEIKRGTVVSQSMQTTTSGVWVLLEISKGPETSRVADLSGCTVAEAKEILYAQGLSVGEVIENHAAEGFLEGEIYMQSPAAGETAKNGDKVIIYVYRPLQEKDVPKVVGLTLESAEMALKTMGFVLGDVTYSEYSDVPDGVVVSQEPGYGEIAVEKTAVSVVVARAPRVYTTEKVEFTVTVPSGGGTVAIYRVKGGEAKEMLRETASAGEKSYTVELESQTGEDEELAVYVNDVKVHSFPVVFQEAG